MSFNRIAKSIANEKFYRIDGSGIEPVFRIGNIATSCLTVDSVTSRQPDSFTQQTYQDKDILAVDLDPNTFVG